MRSTGSPATQTRSRSAQVRAATARSHAGIRINPATGLAGDYLDQFNQAIMLLESLAATPDCAGDFHAWRPRTYQDYLQSSPGTACDAAIAAYRAADPLVRARFDTLVASMTDVLTATQDVMQSSPPSPAIGMLANRAGHWVGNLVAQARAVVDGTNPSRADAHASDNMPVRTPACGR